MSKNRTKHLIISCLLILPVLVQCANDTREIQDSVKLVFNQKIAAAKDDSAKKMEAYYEYGQYLDVNGEKDPSIENLKIAFRIAQNIGDDKAIAAIGNYLASTYWEIGIYQPSTDVYIIAYESAVRTGDSSQIAKISMNLGTNYNYMGDYNNAIKYALNALRVKETAKDWERICYHYVAMAKIFKETNNTQKWEHYIQKAYKMKDVENCASFSDIAKIFNNLGAIAEKKGDFKTALAYYDTLFVLSKEAEYDKGISAALRNSSQIYKQLNQPQKSLELSLEAEKYFGDPYEVIFSNNSKAELYRMLGEDKKALELAMKNTTMEDLNFYSLEHEKTLKLLYELNASLSNYKEAFRWNDSLRFFETQLRDEEVRKGIEELETKYETEKKEHQIELLTTENLLKSQRLNAGIAILAILIIVILLIVYIQNIRKKQADLLQNDLKQQVLRAQMNPHFIFNVLGSIQNFMMQNDLRKASDFLSQFASLTRATLHNSAAETISLSDEINMLKNYIELEKMRNPEKFNFEIITQEDLESDFILIPPMMIQPFIENAIKHGFKNIDHPGFLRLQISDKNECVEFSIEDNGSGIQEKDDEAKKHQSMALIIFEKRRKLIQQKYKREFKFEMQNLHDINPELTGVKISISIPILNND